MERHTPIVPWRCTDFHVGCQKKKPSPPAPLPEGEGSRIRRAKSREGVCLCATNSGVSVRATNPSMLFRLNVRRLAAAFQRGGCLLDRLLCCNRRFIEKVQIGRAHV